MYTPREWEYEDMTLVCSECEESIFKDKYTHYADFRDAEEAAWYAAQVVHKCAPTQLKLKEAKELMILYRERHPKITFEEQMEVYNLILQL